jgi:hypothetical protein
LILTAALVLNQPTPRLAVIDISAEDAIYEDVSRGLAESLTRVLNANGLTAVRIDESELPPTGCRLGPCLGVAARAKGAVALVTLDAEELSPEVSAVVVTVMRATNGEPLAGGRYRIKVGATKPPKPLTAFLAQVKKAMSKL